MKTVTVVGASGAVGVRLFQHLRRVTPASWKIAGTHFERHLENTTRLDVTDTSALTHYIATHRPNCVVWLSGTKNVKKCELDHDFAYNLNTRPIEVLVERIQNISPETRVIYLSTDYVFDGSRGGYTESDACDPKTIYGRSKYLAEQILQASSIDYLILRSSAILNRREGFLAFFLNELKNRKAVELYSNTFFSPTPIEVVNQALSKCIEESSWKQNIFHIAGPRISRYLFGCDLVEALGVDRSKVSSISADLRHSTFQLDLSLQTSTVFFPLTRDLWQESVKEAMYD